MNSKAQGENNKMSVPDDFVDIFSKYKMVTHEKFEKEINIHICSRR